MTDDALVVVIFATALSCGLVGGVFFTFSTFILAALARLPAREGIAAMQAINITVITPPFMLALFGTGVACLVLAGDELVAPRSPDTPYLVTGGLLYLVGNVVVTTSSTCRGTMRWRLPIRQAPVERVCGRTTSSPGPCGTMSGL
jgi:uncharacterized membrane protein